MGSEAVVGGPWERGGGGAGGGGGGRGAQTETAQSRLCIHSMSWPGTG